VAPEGTTTDWVSEKSRRVTSRDSDNLQRLDVCHRKSTQTGESRCRASRAGGVVPLCFRIRPITRYQSIRAHRMEDPRRLRERRRQRIRTDARRLSLAGHPVRVDALRRRQICSVAATGGYGASR
jgi:hypothetical protein